MVLTGTWVQDGVRRLEDRVTPGLASSSGLTDFWEPFQWLIQSLPHKSESSRLGSPWVREVWDTFWYSEVPLDQPAWQFETRLASVVASKTECL